VPNRCRKPGVINEQKSINPPPILVALPPFNTLLSLAQAEVTATIDGLPAELVDKVRALPVTYESRPTPGMAKDDVPSDTFGLFCGEALNDPPSPHPVPNQIILFLEVIWEFAGSDQDIYLEEINTTYLHELGHYFGFNENDLAERGLD